MEEKIFASIESVQRLEMNPNDVLVIKTDHNFALEQIDYMASLLGHKVIVISRDSELLVITKNDD